jgi:predicted nucleic acid-binding protein
MKYVLDSSVAAKWVLPEKDSDKAIRLRDNYRQGIHQLITPDWFTLEVMNILGKAAARKIISPALALQDLADVLRDAPVFFPSLPLANSALQLALKHQRAVYDCLYLALAQQEICDLVTADDALVRQLQPIYGCLVALSSLP